MSHSGCRHGPACSGGEDARPHGDRCSVMEPKGQPSAPPTDPTEPMLRILNGHCLEQALYVAAVLGLADLLTPGPRDAAGLAEAAGADPAALLRLLGALDSVGVFEEAPDGRF